MSDGMSSRLASLLGLSGTTESRGESPAYRATLLLQLSAQPNKNLLLYVAKKWRSGFQSGSSAAFLSMLLVTATLSMRAADSLIEIRISNT